MREIYEWEWMEVLNNRQEEYFNDIVAPALTELFESNEFRGMMKPYNYDAIKKSKTYKHILRTLISNRKLQNQFWKKIKNDRLKLSKLIADELVK